MPNAFIKELRRIISAYHYSRDGLRTALKTSSAFRTEGILFIILLPIAFIIGDNAVEIILLISSMLLIPLIELINCAIENTVDLACKEIHPLAKAAKDQGSAAVFLALMNMLMVWLIIIFF